MKSPNDYINQLYPLQDKFLSFFNLHNQRKFYLTGGTALSRFYFQHRFSDDLDFFSAKELDDFRGDLRNILNAAKKENLSFEVETISDTFARIFLQENETTLKIDFVNEPVFRWGELKKYALFECVDNQINILANKISAISRHEVKDIADIWILAKELNFSWQEIMSIALKKAPVDPIDVSKVIKTLPLEELQLIKWAKDIELKTVYQDLQTIAGDILLGKNNSLCG